MSIEQRAPALRPEKGATMYEEDKEFEVLQELAQDRLRDDIFDDSVYGQEDSPTDEDDAEYELDDDLYLDDEDEY